MIAKRTCYGSKLSIKKLSNLIVNICNNSNGQVRHISSISLTSSRLFTKKYIKLNIISKYNESTKSLNWLIKPFREQDQQNSTIDLDEKSKGGRFYHEKIILGHSREQMCDLVFNVTKYKEFVPFCINSEIINQIVDKNRFNLNSPKNRSQLQLKFEQKQQQKALNTLKNRHEIEMPQKFDAKLEIGYPPIKESYISHVSMIRPHMVKAISTETRLFEYLINEWKFHKLDNCSHPNKLDTTKKITSNENNESKSNVEDRCLVEFYVSFKFHSPLYAEITNLFLDKMFKQMVGAFTRRARQVYGPPSIEPTSLHKS
jgi:ribosome-associated toxin RatA of RatAB toxin-antitoxin module